jgi:hypothetical protein
MRTLLPVPLFYERALGRLTRRLNTISSPPSITATCASFRKLSNRCGTPEMIRCFFPLAHVSVAQVVAVREKTRPVHCTQICAKHGVFYHESASIGEAFRKYLQHMRILAKP